MIGKNIEIESRISINKTKYVLLIIGAIFSIIPLTHLRNHYFWDLDVYSAAVNAFQSGGSAYHDLEGLRFVYSPYILMFLSLFGANLSLFY